MLVANLLDVFCEVTEEDWSKELGRKSSTFDIPKLTNVVFPDFLGDLDIRTVDGTEEQATVQTELHVGRARRLGAGRGDVLADVRSGDEDLCERDGVVGQEVEAEEILRLGVGVDDARDVDDQPDGL